MSKIETAGRSKNKLERLIMLLRCDTAGGKMRSTNITSLLLFSLRTEVVNIYYSQTIFLAVHTIVGRSIEVISVIFRIVL